MENIGLFIIGESLAYNKYACNTMKKVKNESPKKSTQEVYRFMSNQKNFVVTNKYQIWHLVEGDYRSVSSPWLWDFYLLRYKFSRRNSEITHRTIALEESIDNLLVVNVEMSSRTSIKTFNTF